MMPLHKLKSIYIILGIALVISFLSACEQKNAEPKSQEATIPVKVFNGMQLGSLLNEVVTINDAADIESILKKEWYSAVNVKSLEDAQTTYSINNCNEYFKNSDKDITPVRESEINAYAELALMCQVAKDIIESTSSTDSFLDDFELDIELPNKLPKQLAMVISTAESERINSNPEIVTWGDVNKITNIDLKDQYKAIYSYLGANQEIELIAQADFDIDGIEDILISSRDSVENGSYSALRVFCITKRKQDGVYEICKEYSY